MGELPNLTEPQQKLNRLLGYLEVDPGNLNLIADACATALDAGLPDKAVELLGRYETIAPLSPALQNFSGLAAIKQERFEEAAAIFESLLVRTPDEPGLRFNLAWCRAILGDDARAAELVDDVTAATISGAAVLKVQSLHRLGDLEGALKCGTALSEIRPNDSALMGAVSLVAIDSQMPELARAYASKAESTADGLSSLGVLVMQDNRILDALSYFDRGLAIQPNSARNLLGKGLALMAAGDAGRAVTYIDRSAEIFGTHLGTWIASGWAHFAVGERMKARAIFEKALALDDSFSESHGALAVLDILDGDFESGQHRMEVALRLDRRCFAGALAKSLLLEHAGNPEAAQRVRDITLNTPLESGRSIADAMIAIAPNWLRGGSS